MHRIAYIGRYGVVGAKSDAPKYCESALGFCGAAIVYYLQMGVRYSEVVRLV